MNRHPSFLPTPPSILVEALEPRIAPAGLLNESKFTSVVVGGTVLLDASGGPTDFQGLSTGFGSNSGTYLLYLTTGKALVYTTDLNGDGKFEAGEITGIALAPDSLGRAPNLILFSDVHGDIATNLLPGHGISALTDSDNNPNNGRDGRVLLPNDIGSITLRTITAADLDSSIPGDTVASRLALTSFSIFGTIYSGGNFGGLTIDKSGDSLLTSKFDGVVGIERYVSPAPQVGGIETGSAASGQTFHFTQNASNNVEGAFQTFTEAPGQHGGDISNVAAASPNTIFSVGVLATGDGGSGARGGDISNVVMHGDTGGYTLIAGDGGTGAMGGQGGSIVNFNDLGTITGQVVLHTGSGGTGTLSTGGAGGTATFATVSISADVNVLLGGGGSGFTVGGDGASLPAVVITSPEPKLPIGSKFIGTWHDLGDVGNTHPDPTLNADGTISYTYSPEAINFNAPSFFSDPVLANSLGDNFGDGVFTTSNPGQVEVVFGDGGGGLHDNGGSFNLNGSETVLLRVPGLVNPVVTVGDFNGDGRPDIAVASNSPNNFAGVYVFLNQIGTALDPINARNFSKNPLGDHPFSEALQTAIPSLTDFAGIFNGPAPVLGLTTGDFNGDGIADIGLVEQVVALNGVIENQIGVLFGEPAHNAAGLPFTYTHTDPFSGAAVVRNAGSGFFYANPAAPGAAPTLQFQGELPNANVILKSTSLAAGNGVNPANGNTLGSPEVFFYGPQGSKTIDEAFATAVDPITHQPLESVLTLLGVAVGEVDTNRALGTPTAKNITTVAATLQDFTVVDLNNDGTTDLVFLTKTPVQFITTARGDGAGDFIEGSINPKPPLAAGDNDGIFLGTNSNATTITGVDDGGPGMGGDGQFNEVGIMELNAAEPYILELHLISNVNTSVFYSGGAPRSIGTLIIPTLTLSPVIQGVDGFYIFAPTPDNLYPVTGFGVISPDTSDLRFSDLFLLTDYLTTYERFFTENGYFLNAGNGGNSTVGVGGHGGSIGTPTLTASNGDLAGVVQIVFPQSLDFSGEAFLLAGNGGNGFGGGGGGGSIEGTTVRYAAGTTVLHSNVLLSAGNGGNGLAGNGGNGGGIDQVSITSGVFFSAGNGGSGLNGGTGGNIVGNGVNTSYDTTDGGAALTATEAAQIGLISLAEAAAFPTDTYSLFGVGLGSGAGGQGNSFGGQGGSITNWNSIFNDVLGGTGGSLYYASGAGGSAAGGTGGSGGAITNSSPNVNQNNLSGDLHLQTGAGGSGLIGGNGGAITTFVNSPTNETAVAGLLSVVTGSGGTGVVGSGGSGGAITGFQSNATGLVSFAGEQLLGLGRVIAGDGGASFGGQGGDGGTISNITAQTTSTPIVVAAGAGGTGLTIGGQGGAVLNSQINSAAQQIGKVLIVAGAGGNAASALTTDVILIDDGDVTDLAHVLLAFGGASPHAGDGGNITSITQPISTQTAVDLIAGNGGSTVNAGTSLDQTTGVGRGGSVTDVNLTGTVGAISRNLNLGVTASPPIQAYASTDEFGVTTTLPITSIIDLLALPDSQIVSLNDTATASGFASISGNVGIVAGAAGQVRAGRPASDGLNGSVQNVTAESILSIVAGSVTSVAPVNILSGISVTDPDGVLGADRSPTSITLPNGVVSNPPNGLLDYYDQSGQHVTNLQAGYSLVGPGGLAGDGAIFAITIEQTVGTILRGPRVFPVTSS